MSRKSKAALLAEAAAAELQAKSQPFAEQDPYVSLIGRDADVRFPKGNAGGFGNLHARHCANMLTLFRSRIDEQRLDALIKVLYDKAYAGDLGAIKLIISYSIDKPTHAPHPDGIEHDEWKRYQESAVRQKSVTELLATLPSNLVNDIVRTARPAAATTWAENHGRPLQRQESPADTSPVGEPEEKSIKSALDAPEEYVPQVQEFEAALAILQNDAPISNRTSATSAEPVPSKHSARPGVSTKPIANSLSKNEKVSLASRLPTRDLTSTLLAQVTPLPNGKSESVPGENQQRAVDQSVIVGSSPMTSDLQISSKSPCTIRQLKLR